MYIRRHSSGRHRTQLRRYQRVQKSRQRGGLLAHRRARYRNPLPVAAIVTGALTTAASSAASDAPTAVQILPLELRSLDPSAFGDWDRPVNVQPKFDIPAPKR